jgi:hypothetical protein
MQCSDCVNDCVFTVVQELCTKGATILQTKSLVVEEAATELICMSLDLDDKEEDDVEYDKKGVLKRS